jgi:hypothetical protein
VIESVCGLASLGATTKAPPDAKGNDEAAENDGVHELSEPVLQKPLISECNQGFHGALKLGLSPLGLRRPATGTWWPPAVYLR